VALDDQRKREGRGEGRHKTKSGEVLLYDLFRLLQVVKIHQSNNRLFSDIVASFKKTLNDFWEEGRPAALTLYRGRFYLNDERITYSPSMWATAVKMSAFFQERGLGGLKLMPTSHLYDDSVVGAVDAINKCSRYSDPFEWLFTTLAEVAPWAVPSKDETGKLGLALAEGASSPGGRQSVMQHSGQSEARLQARNVYSHGLTVLRSMVGRLSEGKRAGIQKSKRVVEELIDLMSEHFRIYLALSTIRDLGDQLFTHSLNVAILSMAMGRRLGLSKVDLERLGLTALFHDLGKTTDFLAAADKPESLAGRDLAVVKNHSLGSVARIIRLNASHAMKLSMLKPVSEHHVSVSAEAKAKRLSLGGKILAIADHYDAMTSWRPWRAEPMSPSMALRTMASNSGTDLDPLLVRLFVEMMGPWPVGSVLVLDSKELALTEAPEPGPEPYPPAFLLIRNPGGTLDKGPEIKLGKEDPAGRKIVGSLSPVTYGLQAADYLL
jgi:putative nucleotidyltransferase with HDIG domain